MEPRPLLATLRVGAPRRGRRYGTGPVAAQRHGAAMVGFVRHVHADGFRGSFGKSASSLRLRRHICLLVFCLSSLPSRSPRRTARRRPCSLRVLRGPLAAASVAHHEAAQEELHDLQQARAALPHRVPLEYRAVVSHGHDYVQLNAAVRFISRS